MTKQIRQIIKQSERIQFGSWNELCFGGTQEEPWFIPFGHLLARDVPIAGGKGANSSRQYEWTEMGQGRDITQLSEADFNKYINMLKETKTRVPFSYIATDYYVCDLLKRFGVDVFYTQLWASYDLANLKADEIELVGNMMREKIMSICGNLTDAEFNKMTNDQLEEMGILDDILAIEKMFEIISLITGQKIVSTRSNGVAEDGKSKGFHGKGKTTLYRINPLEIFRGNLISIASRYENAWQSYVYTNASDDAKLEFDKFTTEFAVLIMNMIPNQTEGGTTWTVESASGNEDTVILQKTVKNGEASVASVGGADEFIFSKKLLLAGYGALALIGKSKGETLKKLERAENGETHFVDTTPEERNIFLLTDKEAAEQALSAVAVDMLYGRTTGDFENGRTLYKAGEQVIIPGRLVVEDGMPVLYTASEVVFEKDYVEHYMVQGRPTTLTLLSKDVDITYRLGTQENNFSKNPYQECRLFSTGTRAGSPYKNVAKGVVVFGDIHDPSLAGLTMAQIFYIWEKPVRDYAEKNNIPLAEVPKIGIFTETTNHMEPYLAKYAFLGNFEGGNPCSHTIGYCGEINILGGYNILQKPETGNYCTIDAEDGVITFYEGELPYTIITTDITDMPESPIPISAISGVSSDAGNIAYRFNRKNKKNGGIGLARLEALYAALGFSPFIYKSITDGAFMQDVEAWINKQITTGKITDPDAFYAKEMEEASKMYDAVMYQTRAYATPMEYLEVQIRYFAAKYGVYNEDFKVVIRSCDYKFEEFKGQPGAKYYIDAFAYLQVPEDQLRGAMLLTQPACRFIVEAEMKAIKYCREVLGYKHVSYEYAFVRTVREYKALDEISNAVGLDASLNYLMLEIGNNFVGGKRFLMHLAEKALIASTYYEEYVPQLGKIVKVAYAECKQGGNDTESSLFMISRLAGSYVTTQEREEVNDDSSFLANQLRVEVYNATGIWIKLGYCGNAVSVNYKIGEILMRNGYDSISVTPYNIIRLTYKLAGRDMDGVTKYEIVKPMYVAQAA